MEWVTKELLTKALIEVGLNKGDLIFVHSDLRRFRFQQPMTREELLSLYKTILLDVVGPEGTIAVPAYFYEYARYGTPFHVESSPVSSTLGVFSQWIASDPQSIRSLNPLQSIAAIGKLKNELSGSESLYGYGITSPWQKMIEYNGKFLFLGAPFQSMTFVHHIEQVVGVPHLYNKIFSFPVFKGNDQIKNNPISAVRYLNYDIHYDLSHFKSDLQELNILKEKNQIAVVDARKAFDVGHNKLKENPYYFLKSPPQFVAGHIPTDGNTEQRKNI